jgi:hypothetical protein
MSVQLILYPQSYNGQYNAVSNVASEKLVDGITFTTINVSSSYDNSAALPIIVADTLTNAPPTIINTWYRFRSTVSGTPTLPTQASGKLVLNSTTTDTACGVYQKLSNLVVGQQYIVTTFFEAGATGHVNIRIYSGTTLNATQTTTSLTTFIQTIFTAQSTTDIVFITYLNTVADDLNITKIQVLPTFVSPTNTTFSLEDGQVICDLYQEEDIPLTLSVDEFKNVAEKVQSYSKDFNLPATKRNNQIFDNIFEITRSDDGVIFNPYIKTQCVLKQDGYILFEGYLRLIDIQDQAGEISYNVNLYSEAVALADVLKDKTFNDIDFTELEHEYNKTQIKYSWNDGVTVGQTTPITWENSNTSGYRTDFNTLKYPFVNWSGNIKIADQYNTNNATAGYPELANLNQVFRPFINLKYLINRIFQDTPFTWSSTVFDSADFGKLYMDFNWGASNSPVVQNQTWYWCVYFGSTSTPSGTNYATTSYAPFWFSHSMQSLGTTTPPNYNTSSFKIISTVSNEIYQVGGTNLIIENTDTVSRTVECQWLHTASGVAQPPIAYSGVITIPAGDTYTYTGGNFTQMLVTIGDTLEVQFKTNTGTASKVKQIAGADPWFTSTDIGVQALSIVANPFFKALRGEVGQWEFLKGILTMFNIVSLPDKDNPLNITFETYADVFIDNTDSKQLDWTDKIDVSEMKLLPLTDLNKQTIFKFVEDDSDYAFNLYKKSTQHLYGSKKYDASAYTILDGEDEIIAEPFAATVPVPLGSQFPDFIVPAIYTSNEEATEFEGFENSPRIMYDNGKQLLNAGVTYYIPPQNGLTSENQANFLQFSHLSAIPTVTGTLDFNFETHQLLSQLGAPVPNNLFNFYWLPYYNELYNPNTRIMTLKVNLTPADINTFMFYHKVMIKNREFRVNKIDYKPNNLATVEFILVP